MKVLVSASLVLWAAAGDAQAAVGRLFASAQQCESAKALAPGACRTAFANALAEFAAKAPSYHSRRACFRQFGPCMPWPIGTRRFSEFRPQWIGITLGSDMTAVPAMAPGRIKVDFAPQPVAALSPEAVAAARAPAAAPAGEDAGARIMTPDDDGEGGANLPAPQAGGGFTMIDGVLTYPAPARFQSKGSRHP